VAAARWFEADPELDVVVVLDDWSRPVGLVDRARATGHGQPKRTVLKTRPSTAPETVAARAMAAPPPTASTPWSASTTAATTLASSASNSWSTGS
jgi:hypothetical protein